VLSKTQGHKLYRSKGPHEAEAHTGAIMVKLMAEYFNVHKDLSHFYFAVFSPMIPFEMIALHAGKIVPGNLPSYYSSKIR
jgi:hypothetical protein